MTQEGGAERLGHAIDDRGGVDLAKEPSYGRPARLDEAEKAIQILFVVS
jgi:hypothetical protein